MHTASGPWRCSLAAAMLLLGLTSGMRAEDEPAPGPLDRKVLDQRLFDQLREVINTGADLYNGGPRRDRARNPAGCYYLWQGSLLTLKPMLDHHPDAQKTIDLGLAEAERLPSMRDRALALRAVLDEVRSKLKPAPEKLPSEKKPPEKGPDLKKPSDAVKVTGRITW